MYVIEKAHLVVAEGEQYLSLISLSRVPPMTELPHPSPYPVKTLLPLSPGEQTFNTLGLRRTPEIETMALAK